MPHVDDEDKLWPLTPSELRKIIRALGPKGYSLACSAYQDYDPSLFCMIKTRYRHPFTFRRFKDHEKSEGHKIAQ